MVKIKWLTRDWPDHWLWDFDQIWQTCSPISEMITCKFGLRMGNRGKDTLLSIFTCEVNASVF